MAKLSREQLHNAAIIYQVGTKLGASQRDIQIALITALTESNLINVNYGDRDSLGLFQQRAAWAPAAVRMDPAQSARMFFLGGRQGQRGLFDFKDRENMGMGEAAQAVQVSAFPDRYATHLPTVRSAWPKIQKATGAEVRGMDGKPYVDPNEDPETPTETALDAGLDVTLGAPQYDALSAAEFGALGAKSGEQSILAAPVQNTFGAKANLGLGAQTPLGPETNRQLRELLGEKGIGQKGVNGWRAAVVDLAKELIGDPYQWGGASPGGFDCSGLIQYVYGKLGYELPRISYQQASFGKRVGLNKLRAGDLVAWDNSSRNNGADHIAIYIGDGRIIESPRSGLSVRIRNLGESEGAWGVKLNF